MYMKKFLEAKYKQIIKSNEYINNVFKIKKFIYETIHFFNIYQEFEYFHEIKFTAKLFLLEFNPLFLIFANSFPDKLYKQLINFTLS